VLPEVAVNEWYEQLVDAPFVGAIFFCFRGRKDDPPPATDFHQTAADLQGGKVLASDGMKPEHWHG
jgi:hypothetical protein